MDDLKAIIAKNITDLRKEAKMTQLELAEKLNYSDKAVSKWERGESIPDVGVLKSIADCFGVMVDYLLTEDHKEMNDPYREFSNQKRRNHKIISWLSAVLVWFIATVIFINIDIFLPQMTSNWLLFVYALPVSLIVLLVFNSIWGKRHYTYLIISLLVWSILAAIYLSFLKYNPWLVFVIGIPAEIIIFLCSGLKLK